MNTNIKAILIEAKARIVDPASWTKGALARTKDLLVTGLYDGNAVCYCSLGAVQLVAGNLTAQAKSALESQLPMDYSGRHLAAYNDDPNTKHADVLALFDRAIAASE